MDQSGIPASVLFVVTANARVGNFHLFVLLCFQDLGTMGNPSPHRGAEWLLLFLSGAACVLRVQIPAKSLGRRPCVRGRAVGDSGDTPRTRANKQKGNRFCSWVFGRGCARIHPGGKFSFQHGISTLSLSSSFSFRAIWK